MGARAYVVLEEFSDIHDGECVIEIGSERGEGSTKWLSSFCSEREASFHTVDVDPFIYSEARKIVSQHAGCSAHCMLGEDFLEDLHEQVRFAYLDAFDYVTEEIEGQGWVQDQIARYRELGLDMTNAASEISHLEQAKLVVEKAASRCAILVDDTYRDRESWTGKGALAAPYLRELGFEISDLGGAVLAVVR